MYQATILNSAHSDSIQPAFENLGVGLGLRRGFLNEMVEHLKHAKGHCPEIDFFEVAPENWIGRYGNQLSLFKTCLTYKNCAAHGLCLSLGGPKPLDQEFLLDIRQFLDENNILIYSEHLSASSDDGHLYDLMPLPFTKSMISYVADRIDRVQNVIGRQMAIENISYYLSLSNELSEIDFFLEIIEKANAKILLDVNNVYVNSVNHKYDPHSFIDAIPTDRIAYCHIAGHFKKSDDLIIDTHGEPVIQPVWDLLEYVYKTHGQFPTVLERDFNFPLFEEILNELGYIQCLQKNCFL